MVVRIEHPGCHGLPTAISAKSPSCQVCTFRSDCAHQAFAMLDSLPNNPLTQRERLSLTVTRIALAGMPQRSGDTSVPKAPVESVWVSGRVALSLEVLDSLSRLPARVAKQTRQLMERGWFVFARAELAAGRNPASKGWKRIFCAALLTPQCDRASLELALVEQMNLTPGSARAQVSFGIAIFAAGRIATERFGSFSLTPN